MQHSSGSISQGGRLFTTGTKSSNPSPSTGESRANPKTTSTFAWLIKDARPHSLEAWTGGALGFPKGQLASAARSRDAERRFARKLAEAFREIRRVCKPEGRVVFTFQNLDGRGWNALARAMARAGLTPIRTLPLYGDSSASLHKHSHSISWDAAMVCRLSEPRLKLTIDAEAWAEGRRVAEAWSGALNSKNLEMTDGDRTNIAHAASV